MVALEHKRSRAWSGCEARGTPWRRAPLQAQQAANCVEASVLSPSMRSRAAVTRSVGYPATPEADLTLRERLDAIWWTSGGGS
jgi:hypothetical protein